MPKFPYPATLHQFDETVKLPSELTVIFQEVIRELGLFTFEGRVYDLDDL